MVLWGIYTSLINQSLDALLADCIEQGSRSRIYMWKYQSIIFGSASAPIVSLFMFLYLGNDWKLKECQVVMCVGLVLFLIPTLLLFCFQTTSTETIPIRYSTLSTIEFTATDRSALNSQECQDLVPHTQDVISNILHDRVSISLDESKMGKGDLELDGGSLLHPDRTELADVAIDTESGHHETSQKPSNVSDHHQTLSMQPLFLGLPGVYLAPAMLVMGDIMGGLAAGMTVKFFPIFFMKNLHMQPVELYALYIITPLVLVLFANFTVGCSKFTGRIYATCAAKYLGIGHFLLMIYLHRLSYPRWAVLLAYVVRTAAMNSTKPLTKSSIMDTVPAAQRVRWSALESLNAASWAGSAVLGGYLIDRYGVEFNFAITVAMQFCSTLPQLYVAGLVPAESDAYSLLEGLRRVRSGWEK